MKDFCVMKKKVKSILRDLIWVGGSVSTSTHSIGSGEWSIEVSVGDEYCCEFVGSNGTWPDEEADDLHSLVTEAVQEAEKLFDYIWSKWPEKLRLIRLHSQLIEAGDAEIFISDRISAFADPGKVHLVVVDGNPMLFKSFLGSSSKEEIRQLVRQCVKKGVFPSHTFIPRRYYANRG